MDEFPHDIVFQEYKGVPDGGGGTKDPQWLDAITTEAHVQPYSGTQRFKAQQLQTPVTHRVYYPYQDGVKPGMRVKHGSTILEIKSKPMDQGGLEEVLMVECELP